MNIIGYKTSSYIYYLTCLSTATVFILSCLYNFSLNKNISEVTYQEFHKTEENVYPSLTLCLASVFSEKNLRRYGEEINPSTYKEYLNGQLWDNRMVDIEYDNVTLNFLDYLMGISMVTRETDFPKSKYFLYNHYEETQAIDSNITMSTTNQHNWKPKYYTSYRGANQKCFTFDLPYIEKEKILSFETIFNADIFPEKVRPWEEGFEVRVHYPGQGLTARMRKDFWKDLGKNFSEHLTMAFKIQKLEVMINRKTTTLPCNENWKKHDEELMNQKIKRSGCKPSYWEIKTDFPTCKYKHDMKAFSEFNTAQYDPACKIIQKIMYTYEEFDVLGDWTNGWPEENNMFEVALEFQDDTYMEVQQVRSYGIKDVVGDIGGDLGLFLGFSLSQIPNLIFNLIYWMDDNMTNIKETIRRIFKPRV